MPASVALFVLAGPLTVAIFHYGKFTESDVHMTRLALMAVAFALLGWSLVKVLAPGFYARQDTKTPMRSAMNSLGITMGLNVAFVAIAYFTNKLDDPGLHIVLAATNAVGALANSFSLYRALRRQNVLRPMPGWSALWLRILIANAAMAAGLWWLAGHTDLWLHLATWTRVWRLSACVIGGAAVYFAVLWLAGARIEHFRLHTPADAHEV
jgi:putative peptidoglycan lipid II flippase